MRRRMAAAPGDTWLVITGQLTARTFVETGILDGLRDALGERLSVVLLMSEHGRVTWGDRIGDVRYTSADLLASETGRGRRLLERVDASLDRQLGFYPLALRLNRRFGFHEERMAPGHPLPLLDSSRAGPLPAWGVFDGAMRHWHFSRRRFVPSTLARRFRDECRALVLTNVQVPRLVPFLSVARHQRRPVIGYVASWDHTVGKGVISPHLDRYLVQNERMRDDLARYHGVDPVRVVVTGWPQADAFARRRPRDAYEALLTGYGLEPGAPVVLFAGNTPSNMPHEGAFVARLLEWVAADGRGTSLLVRPHPNDTRWRERFAAALDRPRVHVQEPGFADFEALVTLLHHVDCVVTNGGTFLLDAVVNDRPSVCVAYDEGAPPGESWARTNLVGEHYVPLMESGAFRLASSFPEVVAGIEEALDEPGALAAERRAATSVVVGAVDGHSSSRVVRAILDGLGAEYARGDA